MTLPLPKSFGDVIAAMGEYGAPLLASPVIPNASAELWRRLGLEGAPEEQRLPDAAGWGRLPAGSRLEKGAPLFPRLEPA